MTIKTLIRTTLIIGALGCYSGAMAQNAPDYSAMTTAELIQMRSQVRSMSDEERARFRTELHTRATAMTPEERQQAGLGPRNPGGPNAGQGTQIQKRDGTGNQDRTQDRKRDGTGNQDRATDRTGTGSRYGDGQGARQRQGGGRGN